ncbi:related to dehydrogenase/reductase [Cephalotrichum gorgonifer]|uniref:Related to dehydrogenase/reductase n=1 Tax=Cephalotrichum gorgonifer TaxID=2041049 RepID=A0AAE8N3F5_9PEZI|nr:related to dehydrogenase/reductase [Cephalotrichum gorgonifer]
MPAKYQRSVLVTGGTNGLGYECALAIARQHPEYIVIVAARSDSGGSVERIQKAIGQTNVQFMPLDLGDMAKVRSFAADWNTKNLPPIQSLVLNAALQFPGKAEYSADGFEKTFAISHVGHALLFSLLRPNLADTARIAIVSSGTHDPAQKSGLPDARFISADQLAHPSPEVAEGPGRQHYTNTKMANVMYGYSLHRRFQAINKRHGKNWTVNSFDPGLMPGTGLARDARGFVRFVWLSILPRILPLLRLLITPNVHTTKDSGESLARLAIGSDLEGTSGVYFEGRKAIKSSKESYDEKKQEELWQWTVDNLAKTGEERRTFSLDDLA